MKKLKVASVTTLVALGLIAAPAAQAQTVSNPTSNVDIADNQNWSLPSWALPRYEVNLLMSHVADPELEGTNTVHNLKMGDGHGLVYVPEDMADNENWAIRDDWTWGEVFESFMDSVSELYHG